jgi:hypothetical protein
MAAQRSFAVRKFVLTILGGAIFGAIAGLVIVGLNDDEPAAVTALKRPVIEAPAPEPEAEASTPKVPALVGVALDTAEDQLDAEGIDHDTVGGGLFGIIDRSAWEVCAIDPPAGEDASGGVTLFVQRPGEC